ncbi:MAG: hypothetical protein QOK25_570 [Thermoleophilaceae bacterium]|nr:hypothetical protein [Thermoleophilaceae bacterium]
MVVYRHAATEPTGGDTPPRSFSSERSTISLFLDIGQGAGLAGATGVRPFLPPLLAGALARGDIGIDFDGTSYDFLEKPAFLAGVLALAVVAYAVERARAARPADPGARRDPLALGLAAVALVLGALLFAGSLAQGHRESWPGLVAGVVCAALGYAAVAMLFARARRRLEGGAAGLLSVYADAIALALAGLAIALPPVGLVAVVAFVVLVVRARAGGDKKYEGLRVLR